jgi:electron transfer flavoprotein alpha subunit
MKKTIIIIDDHTDTSQSTIYKELINAALEIEKITAISIHTLLIGNNLDIPAAYFLQQGIDVTCIDLSTHLQTSHLDIALDRIKQFLNTKNPDIIITGHNTFGMSFLPQLAIHLNASCITGVKKITQKNNNLIFTRYIWNGKFESQVTSENKIAAISILPGYFVSQQKKVTKHGTMFHSKNDLSAIKTSIIRKKISQRTDTNSSFDNAAVIVAAGQGIGDTENIKKIRLFSQIFQHSAIAGSRPIIDMGWLPYKYQVGITGQTVAPQLYIACGISGASQHIAGMRKSKYIVGINKDPNAAIFNVCDLCIVSDICEFIDVLNNEPMTGPKAI